MVFGPAILFFLLACCATTYGFLLLRRFGYKIDLFVDALAVVPLIFGVVAIIEEANQTRILRTNFTNLASSFALSEKRSRLEQDIKNMGFSVARSMLLMQAIVCNHKQLDDAERDISLILDAHIDDWDQDETEFDLLGNSEYRKDLVEQHRTVFNNLKRGCETANESVDFLLLASNAPGVLENGNASDRVRNAFQGRVGRLLLRLVSTCDTFLTAPSCESFVWWNIPLFGNR